MCETRYPHWTVERIRFGDLDRYDHVNNVAYATYSESARLALLTELDGFAEGGFWVIVRLCIDYHAETRYPGAVHVGSCVPKVGRSSATILQGMFAAGRCVASAECVVVWLDTGTRKPVSMSKGLRERLLACGPAS
jgi:acyl-CoA thioester hydrolase